MITARNPLRNFSTKKSAIEVLTNRFLANFNNFTRKMTTNYRAGLGETKMNIFLVCRILRCMTYFDQKILGTIFRELDSYKTNYSALFSPKTSVSGMIMYASATWKKMKIQKRVIVLFFLSWDALLHLFSVCSFFCSVIMLLLARFFFFLFCSWLVAFPSQKQYSWNRIQFLHVYLLYCSYLCCLPS